MENTDEEMQRDTPERHRVHPLERLADSFSLLYYLLAVLGFFLVYAILTDTLSLIYVIFTFLVIILIDFNDYRELPGTTDSLALAAGATLMATGLFLDVIVDSLFDIRTEEGLGSMNFIPILIGMLVFLYGFGFLRDFFVPLGISLSFLAISVIPSTSWGENIHEPFVNFTVESSMRIIEMTDYNAYNRGADITLIKAGSRDTVTVDRGCSGFESTTYFAIFGSFLLWKLEGERWKKMFIIAVGIAGLLLMNVLRVTLLILIYFWYDMDMLKTFHSNLGNVLFIFWVGFIWWISFAYLLPSRDEDEGGEKMAEDSDDGDGLADDSPGISGMATGRSGGSGVRERNIGFGERARACGEAGMDPEENMDSEAE